MIGFEEAEFAGKICAELERLRENEIVRLVDLLVVRKSDDGEVEHFQHSDLTLQEAMELSAAARSLLGFGLHGGEASATAALGWPSVTDSGHVLNDSDIWYLDDAIPPGTAAAIALVEHRWAITLRNEVKSAGGFHLADSWIHPVDLIAVGLQTSADEGAERASA